MSLDIISDKIKEGYDIVKSEEESHRMGLNSLYTETDAKQWKSNVIISMKMSGFSIDLLNDFNNFMCNFYPSNVISYIENGIKYLENNFVLSDINDMNIKSNLFKLESTVMQGKIHSKNIISGIDLSSRRVFIVHGHDDAAKLAVARFLEAIDIEPIILHEQANSGTTIIEKFEKHADVAFAVILMTPDDVGGKDEHSLKPRARQNVVAELGYFIGRLGRKGVAALVKGEVDIPSDFSGVAYTTLDDHGAWKTKLAKEMRAAGLKVDADKVLNA
jgi:predicted nucleotide-binding protein